MDNCTVTEPPALAGLRATLQGGHLILSPLPSVGETVAVRLDGYQRKVGHRAGRVGPQESDFIAPAMRTLTVIEHTVVRGRAAALVDVSA